MTGRWTAVAKVAVVAAITGALLATGHLSLAAVGAVVARPWTLAALVILQIVILGVGVLRWQLLLSTIAGRPQSFRALLAYNWIGQFFGTFAPSTVATDVTRFTYVVRSGAAAPPAVLASLFIDRIAGMAGTIALAMLLAQRLVLESVTRGSLVILGVVVVLIVVAAAAARRFREAMAAVRRAKGASLVAVFGAMAAMALKVLSIWLIVRAVRPGAAVAPVFSVAPVGFLVEAIPLAPGGLGTAHLAFDYLLGLQGIPGGAGVFNAYFVVRLLVSLGGGVIYALPGGPRSIILKDAQPDRAGVGQHFHFRGGLSS